jgi:hypothetical protein
VRTKLIVWLALAVVFTTVQCVSACTIEACSKAENLPPCHKHHDSRKSEPCSHQAVLANAYALPTAGITLAPVMQVGAAVALPFRFTVVLRNAPPEDGVSPPWPDDVGSTVLRI